MPEYRGNTLAEAVRLAVGREKNGMEQTSSPHHELKRIPEVYAPPLFWGPWVEIFAQAGVIGRDSDEHVTKLKVSFSSVNRPASTFDVEISGGDRDVEGFGPGAETITISGNVATGIKMRAKSHAFYGQSLDVNVRQLN